MAMNNDDEDEVAAMQERLNSLTADEREAIRLMFSQGPNRSTRTLEECAEHLQMPLPQFRKLQGRALAKLRRHPGDGSGGLAGVRVPNNPYPKSPSTQIVKPEPATSHDAQ